jgi:hypothetical protein
MNRLYKPVVVILMAAFAGLSADISCISSYTVGSVDS